jgi:hypothetical protein
VRNLPSSACTLKIVSPESNVGALNLVKERVLHTFPEAAFGPSKRSDSGGWFVYATIIVRGEEFESP